jgi:hypothetical protein
MKNRPYCVLIECLAMGIVTPAMAHDDSPGDQTVVSVEARDMEAAPASQLSPPPAPAPDLSTPKADEPLAEASRFHLSLGADVTTAYYFRGYRNEDSGWIVQPYADMSLDVVRLEDATISLTLGTWNSFHGEATAAGTSDSFTKTWYESDLYAGVGLATGKWTLEARYSVEASPSDAWATIKEASVSAAYDDSDLLGAWSLTPTATLVIETGSQAIDGGRTGTYLQLDVSPGFAFEEGSLKDVAVSFPLSVGLSLGNYYEGANGENDVFGYASVGTDVSVPLNLGESWGGWTLHAGVQGLFLGDATSTFNDGHHFEAIGTAGVSIEF